MTETSEVEETLAVPLTELRPSLEALLMVADQPLEAVTLATAVGYPVGEVTDAVQVVLTTDVAELVAALPDGREDPCHRRKKFGLWSTGLPDVNEGDRSAPRPTRSACWARCRP